MSEAKHKLTIRDRLLRGLIRWIGSWQLSTAHCLGNLIGRVLWRFPNKPKCVAFRNIERCFPQQSPQWQASLVRRYLKEFGKAIVEAPSFWFQDPKKLKKLLRKAHGYEAFQKAFELGRGVIILGAHMGAFEFPNVALGSNYPVTWIYRPQKNAVEDLIFQARKRLGTKLVPTNLKGVAQLYQAIKAGEAVGLACDHDPGPHSGVFVPLFGLPAWTLNLAPRLAKVRQSPVFFIFAERLPKSQGFDIHILPLPHEIYDDDETVAVTAINQTIEKAILMCPEQYEWHYQRFRRQPPEKKGQPGFYDGSW